MSEATKLQNLSHNVNVNYFCPQAGKAEGHLGLPEVLAPWHWRPDPNKSGNQLLEVFLLENPSLPLL